MTEKERRVIRDYLDALQRYEDATQELGGVCQHSLIALNLRNARENLNALVA